METPRGTYYWRPRGGGHGGRGARPPPPSPGNTSPRPNIPQPNNPQIPQRRNLSRPTNASQASPLTRDRVEMAVVKAHAEMVAAGESVSSWKVAQAAALFLQAGSWGALGYAFTDVPTLRNIQSVERKVNAFIHCFVSVRRMTSLYDLNNELCKNEGVEKFEELGLGSLLKHPLIQQYFSIPSDATEICEITIDNLLSGLSTFIVKHKNREIPVDEFLEFLLKKHPVARKEYLGVRIMNFGLYIGLLKGIRRNEGNMLRSFKEIRNKRHEIDSSISIISQEESGLTQGDDYCDSLHRLFSLNGENFSSRKSKLQNSYSSNVHMKSFGLTIEELGGSDFMVIQLDPRKFGKLELTELDIRMFVATWINECSTHSTKKVLELMLHSCGNKGKTKKFLRFSNSFLGSMLLEIAVKAIKSGFFDHLLKETETARCTGPDLLKGEIYDEVTLKFIWKWREPCNKRPIYEVIALMLYCYVKSPGKAMERLQKAFLIFPGVALLNLAVDVIKRSSDNSIEGTSTSSSFTEAPKPADLKNQANSQVVPSKREDDITETELTEELNGPEKCVQEETELKNPPDVTEEGIIMKITSYFGMNCTFDNDNYGINNNKDMLSIKKLLCHGCEMWLKREFSVKDFSNLGFGDFYDFLKQHISSLPKELHFLAEVNSCNYLEVSLNQKQLHLMLDQARRNLGEKAHLDRSYICHILRNQFPSISLNVIETKNTLLNASACPYSVHFSSTLITSEQDFGPMHGQVEGSGDVCKLSFSSLELVSAKDARECLIKAPFLTDLQLWSHWDSMFKPSLGPLVQWLLLEGYIEGFSCIVTNSGCVLRVNDHVSFDDLIEAFLHGLPAKVALIFLSLFVIHGGSHNIPLSLMKYSLQHAVDIRIKSASFLDCKKILGDVSSFIIDCLDHLPPEFRNFMAEVMISTLFTFTRDACQIILSQCKKAKQRVMLHEIGLSLGIVEWIHDYKEFCADPMVDLDTNLNAVSEILEPEGASPSTVEIPGITSDDVIDIGQEMSRIFDDKISSDVADDEQIQRGNNLIETIRREEFGLDMGSSLAENALLKKQHARLGRALQCLSNELYSHDSHFILELVQNADDNNYSAGVEPTLVFILHSNGIVALNNEKGFSDKNIRALCDVGNSTKKGLSSGYIGKKGIGFKSVFRVTDAPEIHSNGFHVKFDISEGEIGFILPTAIARCDMKYINEELLNDNNQAVGESWGTCIILPFKPNHKSEHGRTFVLSMFSELHPSLLLFLKNLKCIRFKNTLDGTLITMRKETGVDGIVLISHGTEEMNWLVVDQELDAPELRPEVKTTRIALAFGLNKNSTGDYEPNLDQQPTFAYLPLRQYGMRFILQADFSLPSSREEVHHDSAWNQWLLLRFPDLFIASLKSFCQLSCFRDKPGKAISAFMGFVPLVGEVHGFFASLPHMILSRLRASDCLLREGFDHEWILPCRTLRGWDDNVRSVISDSLLQQHGGLGYLKRDIILTDSLAKELAVQEYGPNLLVKILESVCSEHNDINALGVGWLSAWINLFHKTLSTQSNGNEHDLFVRLKMIPFVPLSDGSYVSSTDGSIWVPCNVSALELGDSCAIEQFHHLYTSLRIVNPAILSYHSDKYRSTGGRVDSILAVLYKLGVKPLSTHDVIQCHILKYNFSQVVETKKWLLVEFLSFVFNHFQSPCSECCLEKAEIIEKLKKEPIILTNSGFKSPSTESIHFSKEYGNCISVEKLICGTGIIWHEVDRIYLKHTSYAVAKWRDFLKDLGVIDFVKLIEVHKNVKDLELPSRDWVSPEMDAFLSEISRTGNLEKSKYLLGALDKFWDDYFCKEVDEQSEPLFILSSFVKRLCEFKWAASSLDNELHFPTELFYEHEAVFSVLGANAPYAVPKVTSKALLKHLGFKVEVKLDDIVSATQRWKNAASHKASISQMSELYSLSWKMVSSTEKPKHLISSIYIFLPFVNPPDQTEAVPGIFLSPAQVYWDDPTSCLDLINKRDPKGFQTCTISSLYPNLHDFFVTACGVLESPTSDEYFEILLQISHVKSPKEAAHAVFGVILRWADDLSSGKMKSGQLLKLINNLVKEDGTVLPTIQDRWVSLHPNFGRVYWTESKDLMEELADLSDIYFLYFGELTDTEKEYLSGDVANFLEEIGVLSLGKLLCRKAIFYDIVDSSEKACMVNWILPFAQQYIYNKHYDVYLKLQDVVGEKLSQLNVIAVQRLFYKNTLKERAISSTSRIECSCLLEDTTLHVTPDADNHSIILELSRLFFEGTPNLELANFLHSLVLMSEVGSTKQQLELYIKQNQQLLDVPAGAMTWSLKSFTESAEVDSSVPTPPTPVPIHIPFQQRCSKETKRRKPKFSIWPPTSSEVTICPPQMSTDDCPNKMNISEPKDVLNGDCENSTDTCLTVVNIAESNDHIGTMELKDIPACMQKDMLLSEHQDELHLYRTGRAGELVAYKYFTEMLGMANVKWVNEEVESGLPYDITVKREDGNTEYIEVKTTESDTKNWFIISPGEWDFAREKGDLYSIARIFLPNMRKPKVLVLTNPQRLCREKVLKLVLSLTESGGG
ncbi:unnamed protein product [Urochloa humidicola]